MYPGIFPFAVGIFLIASRLFTVCSAVFNWDFFMNSFKSRFWVRILGRTKARVFYGILGIAIVGWGLYILP